MTKHSLRKNEVYDRTNSTHTKEVEARGLYIGGSYIIADGQSEIAFGYSMEADSPPSEITFSVNGQDHTVTVEEHPDHSGFHVAEDTLMTSHVGEILIEAKGESITIQATDPNS